MSNLLNTVKARQQESALQQKAIMDRMQSRQKAADQILSQAEGYDVSLLIPPFRQHWKDFYTQKLQEINNFAIDDPVKARQAVMDLDMWFSKYSGHKSEQVAEAMKTSTKIATDPAAAAKYNDELPIYMQSAATPQWLIQSTQAFEGANIETRMGPDGAIYFKNINAETGEAEGDWANVETWDLWQNPSTFVVPNKPRYGMSAVEIGEGALRESLFTHNKDVWDREEAYRVAQAYVDGGAANEISVAARSWAATKLFGDAMRENQALINAYIEGDVNNPIYQLHGQYLSDINKELVKTMAEASRYPTEEEDPENETGSDRDAAIYRSDFDSSQSFYLDSLQYLRTGELMETDENGMLVPLDEFEMYGGVKGTSYVLSALDTKKETIIIDNPNAGESRRKMQMLQQDLMDMADQGSPEAMRIRREIAALEESGDEPEQFEIQPMEIAFLPNGKIVLLDLSVKQTGSSYDRVKTIVLDEDRDREATQRLLQAIRRTYRDPNITIEGLQAGIVFGPQTETRNAVNDAVNQTQQAAQSGGAFDNYGEE